MAKVILGYRMDSAFGCCDEPGGWSFTIYRKGTVRFRYYLFDGSMIASKCAEIPQSVADELYHTLEKQQGCIDALPSETFNHSCDGAYEIFNFLGKRTSSLNIGKTSDQLITEAVARGLEEETLRAENEILSIFESICPILEPFGLHVIFEPSFECQWEGYSDYRKICEDYRVGLL